MAADPYSCSWFVGRVSLESAIAVSSKSKNIFDDC
jgi:hypothetical protein